MLDDPSIQYQPNGQEKVVIHRSAVQVSVERDKRHFRHEIFNILVECVEELYHELVEVSNIRKGYIQLFVFSLGIII